MLKLSPQQSAVVSFVRDGSGSAFVEAVAGAGKTTTLIEALDATEGSVAFAAYNKKIADEISYKIKQRNIGNRIRVGTFHSFGFNAWRRSYPGVKVDERGKIDATTIFLRARKAPEALDAFVIKLVSLAKQRALGLNGDIDDASKWFEIVEHFDLSYELDTLEPGCSVVDGIELAIETLKYHRDIAGKLINFDDMIYMPIVSGVKSWQNEWVFVDEAQDTNPARRALARKMLMPSGRSLWVGDRHQAIYGFTGADNDAIDKIIKEFGCDTFPLTITYRCPKTVVAEARKIVKHIEAAETAPIGAVSTVDYKSFLKEVKALTAEDAILCRKTKPLVSLAFHLIRNGIPCHVEGREIGNGLIKLVNRGGRRIKTLADLRDHLIDYAERESEKLMAKGRETAAEAVRDRVETILAIADAAPPATTLDELRQRIRDLFEDANAERKPTLTLSTVHKTKGREWPRVFILGRNDYMPSSFARQPWQKDQERNLIYVAVTRSQDQLIFINNVEWDNFSGTF